MSESSDQTTATVVLSDYSQELKVSDKWRYLERRFHLFGVDPYLVSSYELSQDIFPPIICTDIFAYLVLKVSFCTTERFTSFRSLDAYKYFECGFVEFTGGKKLGTKVLTLAKVSMIYDS